MRKTIFGKYLLSFTMSLVFGLSFFSMFYGSWATKPPMPQGDEVGSAEQERPEARPQKVEFVCFQEKIHQAVDDSSAYDCLS